MARTPRDDFDDGPDDGPLDEDIERFSGATRPCPKCATELHDDVDLCWKCGHALGADGDEKSVPIWIIVTAGLVLLAIGVIVTQQVVW
jgi:uncharacterized protein (DUF983 family)